MLNEKLQFTDLSPADRSCFRGPGIKTTLERDTLLFRFTLTDHASPWWGEVKDLPGILSDAQRSGEDFGTFIRKRTAVFKHWNIQKYLIIAKLANPVSAFRGTIAPQSFGARRDYNAKGNYITGKKYTKPVFWGGGFNQVFIPGIKPADYSIVIMPGVIEITDPIDQIIDALISFSLI